jgi:hypothetical protein
VRERIAERLRPTGASAGGLRGSGELHVCRRIEIRGGQRVVAEVHCISNQEVRMEQ